MLATLDAFWQKASLYMNLPKISITDIVEIIIIAFLIYYMLAVSYTHLTLPTNSLV